MGSYLEGGLPLLAVLPWPSVVGWIECFEGDLYRFALRSVS